MKNFAEKLYEAAGKEIDSHKHEKEDNRSKNH